MPGASPPAGRTSSRPIRRGSTAESRRRPGPPTIFYDIVQTDPSSQYDVRDLLAALVDGGRFDEYRAEYGQTLVCGFARLGGIAVGDRREPAAAVPPGGGRPVPVRRRDLRRLRRQGRPVRAGLQPDACPAALPPGRERLRRRPRRRAFGHHPQRREAGQRREQLVVPKITLLVGHSFGAGHYALCGKAFDPRFLFAWPGAAMP